MSVLLVACSAVVAVACSFAAIGQWVRNAPQDTLPWGEATAKFYDRPTRLGRRETRAVQAPTVTDLGVDFPHAAQVAKILRHRTSVRTGQRTRDTGYFITDLTSRQATPERIARIVRSQ